MEPILDKTNGNDGMPVRRPSVGVKIWPAF